MPLDHGNAGAAVFGQPLDVDAIAKPDRNERVARAVGLTRPDLQAFGDSVPDTAAPRVEVKRAAFLIQKNKAVLGCLQWLDRFQNVDHRR